MGGSSWRARAGRTPNKGAKYPHPRCSPRMRSPRSSASAHRRLQPGSGTGALLMLLYRSGLRVSDVNLTAGTVRVLHGNGNKATTRGFHPPPPPMRSPSGSTPATSWVSAAALCFCIFRIFRKMTANRMYVLLSSTCWLFKRLPSGSSLKAPARAMRL